MQIVVPQLDGVRVGDKPLPYALIEGIARAYRYIQQLDAAATDLPTVTVATHLDRTALYPASAFVENSFYIESDRLNVIYQARGGAWIYFTGAYFAAFASRPSDLGTNDAGFLFYSMDTYREYRWSGSAWVEVTPRLTIHDTFYGARSSSIGTVTISSVAGGRYLVCLGLGATTAGAGTVTWTFSWTSGGVVRTITSAAITLTVALTTSALPAAMPVNVDDGTNITYATTYAAPGAYEFNATVTQL